MPALDLLSLRSGRVRLVDHARRSGKFAHDESLARRLRLRAGGIVCWLLLLLCAGSCSCS